MLGNGGELDVPEVHVALDRGSGRGKFSRAGDVLPTGGDSSFSGFYLHGGLSDVVLDGGAKIKAGGQPVVGGNISIKSQLTPSLEVGYFVTPNIAVSFTGGVPPTARIDAGGTMTGQGRIGSTMYGPATLTAHYHFDVPGPIKPYLGLGPAFMVVFRDEDGAARPPAHPGHGRVRPSRRAPTSC